MRFTTWAGNSSSKWNTVRPSQSVRSRSMPSRSSVFTTFSFPHSAASCRALPFGVKMLTLQPAARSMSTISRCPFLLARCSAVWLIGVDVALSGRRSSLWARIRICTTWSRPRNQKSQWDLWEIGHDFHSPYCAPRSNGVSSRQFWMFGSAPCANNSINAVKCPCWAAKCNGVSFSAVNPLGSAGRAGWVSKSLQMSAWPAQEARCKGDEPLVSNSIGLMPSCASKSWTTSLEEMREISNLNLEFRRRCEGE